MKKKLQDEMSERFFGCKDMNRLVNKMDVTRAENAETPQRKGSTLSESELLTKSVRPPKKRSVASSTRELDSMGFCVMSENWRLSRINLLQRRGVVIIRFHC